MKRNPRKHDPDHLEFIRALPCIICRDNISVEACHVRMSDARIGKFNSGVGAKPDDKFTLPICGKHHREQHKGSEPRFWEQFNIDAVLMALALYSVSGDAEEAERIMFARCVNLMAAG